jgi:hypothetical protein
MPTNPSAATSGAHDIHRTDVHTHLREFERLTGTGNVKTANLSVAKLVRSMLKMMETLPSGCNGNCACGGAAIAPLPLSKVAAAPSAPPEPMPTPAPTPAPTSAPVVAPPAPVTDSKPDITPPAEPDPVVPDDVADDDVADDKAVDDKVAESKPRKTKKSA